MAWGKTLSERDYENVVATILVAGSLWIARRFSSFHLAGHYFLYIIGLTLAGAYFLLDGLRRDTTSFQQWFPRVLIFTLFWDISVPLKSVPTFSLLKFLFYLLLLIYLSRFIFGVGRFFGHSDDPYPLCVLLVLTLLLFLDDSFKGVYLSYNTLATRPFLETLLLPKPWAFLLFVLMTIAVISLALRLTLLELTRIRIAISTTAGGLGILLAGYVFLHRLELLLRSSDLRTFALTYESSWFYTSLALQPRFVCFFLYLFASAVYHKESELRKLVDWAFAATFLVLYLEMNGCDIYRAILEVLRLSQTIGVFGSIVVLVIAIIADIIALIEFSKRQRQQT